MQPIAIRYLFTVLAAAGCASYDGESVPSSDAQATRVAEVTAQGSIRGVTMVDPYLQTDRQMNVFDADFTGEYSRSTSP